MKKPTKSIITSSLLAVAFGALSVGSTFALFTSQAKTEVSVQSGLIDLGSEVSIIDAWELNDVPMTVENGVYSNSVGGFISVDSNNFVHFSKLCPGDGANFMVTPDNSGTNINTKMRLVVKLSGELAPALVVKVSVGETEKLAFKGARTMYLPWDSVLVGANPDTYKISVSFPDSDNGEINFESSDNQFQNKEALLKITYEVVQGNAVTDGVLEVINSTLTTKAFYDGDNKTMYDALGDLDAAQVNAIKERNYVWGVNADQFYDFAIEPSDAYNYFKMYDVMPLNPTYSVYAKEGWTATSVTLNGIGFDAGDVEGIASITYSNDNAARDVVIRTNSAVTNITINDDTLGSIYHYGVTGSLNIIQCNTSSYHENGKVAFAEISKGRIVLEEGAEVNKLHISSIKENEQTTNEFDTIIVAIAEGVEKPKFSRDDVEIADTGTLVVALQEGTAEVTEETNLDYVWLTKQGIFEQIKVSDNSETMESAKWADDASLTDTKTQEAAIDIANNIGRNADTQKVEEHVDDYTITIDEESRELIVTDSNDQVIEDVEVIETVVSAGVETTGLSQDDVQSAKEETVDEAIIEEIEGSDKYAVRIGTRAFETLGDAVEFAENGQTITLTDDIEENVSINKDVTLDLAGNTLSAADNKKAALTLYSLDHVTVKNGAINGQIRIGEHQYTIVKWKYGDQTPMYGYHPLAPAKSVTLDNLEVNSGSKVSLYFTNIEDDLTRANESNPYDQDLYGHYIYKTGYQSYEQSINPDRNEIFTVCEYKDNVTVNNCEFTSSNNLVGKMYDINDNLYKDVLTVNSGTFSNDSLGRFLASGKYLVGETDSKFTVETTAPEEYKGKVNNVYYQYAGGANSAIAYANFGETVYIKESSNQEKIFGENKDGSRQELTVVYEVEGVEYTGGVPFNATYDMMVEVDGNSHLFYSAFTPVAAVYATGQGGSWKGATKVGEYGTLKDAFAALSNNYTVVIMKDFTVGDEVNYSYGGVTYKCAAGYASRSTIDFNGHVITYTGTGSCIVSSQSTGYLYIRDSSGTNAGGITVTNSNAYCINKQNAKSDYTYIYGGTYTSINRAPLNLAGGTGITISGGVYKWTGSGTISKGWKVTTLTISGGRYSKNPSSSYLASGYVSTQEDDGMWWVHAG